MKSTVAPRAAAILDFLAVYESRGNYLAYYGHGDNLAPLPATLSDVLQFQSDLVRVRKLASSATGRYQFMPTTLRDLMATHKIAPSTPFTPDFQDVLACALLEKRGYSKWTAGAISTETFADNLSMEWASLPYRTGKSYYDGDGLNHALVSRDKFMAVLLNASKLSNAAGTASKVPAPPIAGANPLSEILGQASKAITDLAQPPAGPSPGVAAPQPAAEQEIDIMGNLLGSVASIIEGVITKGSTVATVATAAPTIIEGAFKSIDEAERGFKALTELVSDIRSGKWNEVPEDITAIIAEFKQIMINFGIDHDGLNAATVKLADTPDMATLRAKAA